MTTESKRLTLREFLNYPWQPPEKIMDPWLPTSGISMIWGGRGGGKTFVTLAMALHIAAGWTFLDDMEVPKPRRVLYVDGEMSAAEVQERLEKLLVGMGPFPAWTYDNLAFLSHECFETGIPDLSEPGRGRRIIEQCVEEFNADLIIFDNLSCLLQSGSENEAESWNAFQHWLLNFRRQHRTVLVIHHAGKPGADGRSKQRGTSKREDILNSSVEIRTTETDPVLHIIWEYSKVRSFNAGEPRHIEIHFAKTDPKRPGVETSARVVPAQSPQDEAAECLRLNAEGYSYEDIGERKGISRATVGRRIKEAKTLEGSTSRLGA